MNSKDIYENRYANGYMEYWDQHKTAKVLEIFSKIDLPKFGKILDFGCGNGIFTNLIKTILPKWEVYGADLSEIAIKNAANKFKRCTFLNVIELENHKENFDIIFTHHVLEHVDNIKETIYSIVSLLKITSLQIHILPCGNENSFEHKICLLKNNGIQIDLDNRFFFEEPGHLRRLTSSELEINFKESNFNLVQSYFSNQYYGGINWITKGSPRFVKKLTSHSDAKNIEAEKELKKLRKKLLPLTYLQFPYTKYLEYTTKWSKTKKDYFLIVLLFFPSLISKIIYKYYDKQSLNEWKKHNQETNGSEMFLVFKR